MHNFRELNIWKRSRELVSKVYVLTGDAPHDLKHTLVKQIQRSVISVPSNIAEGAGRGSDKQFNHILAIAIGSSCELETQLLLTSDLKYLSLNEIELIIQEIVEIRKMIFGFKKSLTFYV